MTASQRPLIVLLLLASIVPLVWPATPPLTDLPNHMSHYRVGLDYAASPLFRQWFEFRWVLVGNLGVDLAVTALAPLLGLEPATKLVVLLIPFLTVAGLILIAREVHGRVPLLLALATPLAYNLPFNFGFVNYSLACALALVAFGSWLMLGRRGRLRSRGWLFVPAGFLIWLAHASGWGLLGVMILGWEAASRRLRGERVGAAVAGALRACLPLTAPFLPILFWSSALPRNGARFAFDFDPARKLAMLSQAFSNGVPVLDGASILLVLTFLILAIVRRDLRFDRRMLTVATLLAILFLLMPNHVLGATYADMRLGPYVLMAFLLAVAPVAATAYTRVAGVVALAFLVVRTAGDAWRYAVLDRAHARQLAALDHLPVGARVLAFARVGCPGAMTGDRMDHLNRMAIVRRQAFTNGSWPWPDAQTMRARPAMVAGYRDENSQMLWPNCFGNRPRTVAAALGEVPRARFTHLWLIDVPPGEWPRRPWLHPVWRNDATILYRIVPAAGL